jgi:hypothetical protein
MFSFLVAIFTWITAFQPKAEPSLLDSLLFQSNNPAIQQILNQGSQHNLQIIYTRVERLPGQAPRFTTYHHVDPQASYYYPASLVKLPIAALALEKLRTLDGVNLNTPIIAWNKAGRPFFTNIGDAIEQMLVLSDNQCYTLLFDWLGQAHIERRLQELGYQNSYILHSFASQDHERFTKVYFSYHGNKMHSTELPQARGQRLQVPDQFLQWKHKTNPASLQYLNYLDLMDIHRMLMSLIYPEAFPVQQRFQLSDQDYAFLRYYLGCFPREADRRGNPDDYWDSYMKFFLNFRDHQKRPSTVRTYNKTGMAGGFISDCAYITDEANGLEFFLSSTLFVNRQGRFEDNEKDYNELGHPFLHALFTTIYEYELQQNRGRGHPLRLPPGKSKE